MITVLSYILITSLWADPGQRFGCDFAGEFEKGYLKSCAIFTETNAIKLNENLHKLIYFKKNGLAEIYLYNKTCYWFSQEQKLKKTICTNQKADPFAEGLSRWINSKGKIGFMNEKLKTVIPAYFDFATPFELGTAKVCVKCTLEISDDQISSASGGTWWIIDRKGNKIKSCPKAQSASECKYQYLFEKH